MSEDFDALAMRIAKDHYWPETEIDDHIAFAHRLVAELAKGQEPVAWITEDLEKMFLTEQAAKDYGDPYYVALYEHPAITPSKEVCECGAWANRPVWCSYCGLPLREKGE